MTYLKPQSPIKFQEDHIYPLTTADQVILEDGSRWDGGAEANEKIENAQSMANDALSKAEDALSKVDDVVNSSGVQSVNGKKGVVELGASDVGAAPVSHTHTPSSIGAAPVSHRHYGTDVNPYIHYASGTGGEEGFVRIARFTINDQYCNAPFQLLLSQRGRSGVCHVNISFDSYLDAGLPYFTVDNSSYYCYMHKAATSTWDLYVSKASDWDGIGVVDFHFTPYLNGGVSVEWTSDQVSTLPEGYIAATLIPNQHKYVPDAYDGRETTFAYSQNDPGTTNWFATWNDGAQLRTMSPTNVRNTIGAAAASHSHSDTYLPLYREAVNVNTVYNAQYTAVAQGTNCPSGSPYGSLLTMPYQAMSGQKKPGFATQIFIPNGDDSKNPNDMFYRTSGSDSWSSWNKVWASNNLKFSLSGSTLSITTT